MLEGKEGQSVIGELVAAGLPEDLLRGNPALSFLGHQPQRVRKVGEGLFDVQIATGLDDCGDYTIEVLRRAAAAAGYTVEGQVTGEPAFAAAYRLRRLAG